MSVGRFQTIPRSAGMLAAILALAGCGPTKPDPVAPTVMREALPLECPAPEVRRPPADLLVEPAMPAPEVLEATDPRAAYCLTRQGLEDVIDALRVRGEREDRWRAWGGSVKPSDIEVDHQPRGKAHALQERT